MTEKIDESKLLEDVKSRQAEILYILCEDYNVYIPQIILGMVNELRSLTKIIKMFEGKEKGFKTQNLGG